MKCTNLLCKVFARGTATVSNSIAAPERSTVVQADPLSWRVTEAPPHLNQTPHSRLWSTVHFGPAPSRHCKTIKMTCNVKNVWLKKVLLTLSKCSFCTFSVWGSAPAPSSSGLLLAPPPVPPWAQMLSHLLMDVTLYRLQETKHPLIRNYDRAWGLKQKISHHRLYLLHERCLVRHCLKHQASSVCVQMVFFCWCCHWESGLSHIVCFK